MGRSSPVLAGAAVAAVLALALVGCGAGTEPGQGGTSQNRSPNTRTAGPTASLGPTGANTPTATHIDKTLTGMAVRGVEPGCVGIETGGKTYQLSGDEARALAKQAGNDQRLGRVRVSGHFAPKGAASTCMMGRVFVVVKLTKL